MPYCPRVPCSVFWAMCFALAEKYTPHHMHASTIVLPPKNISPSRCGKRLQFLACDSCGCCWRWGEMVGSTLSVCASFTAIRRPSVHLWVSLGPVRGWMAMGRMNEIIGYRTPIACVHFSHL